MKFSCLQQDLWPVLQSVSRSCGVRAQLPVLGNILFSLSSGKLKLSATNLEIGVVKSLSVEAMDDGEITIPSRILVEMVANLNGEKLTIESNNEVISISTPTFSSTINGIAGSEFPTIPLSGKEAVRVETKVLLETLPEVLFAAASDEARPVLTGILTEFKSKKLELVATDGYRLAHKSIITKEEGSFKTLVPRKTFEEILRLLSEDQSDQVVISSSEDQNQIIFQFGNTELSSRLIEGSYPAWEKIIPAEFKSKVIVEKNELLKAVKLASVFARNEANIVKLNNSPDKITLESSAKELGSQKKEIEAKGEGESLEVAFNTKFLIDALSAVKTSQLILELSGNLSAAVIKPMGEEGLEYIIMPVNLS